MFAGYVNKAEADAALENTDNITKEMIDDADLTLVSEEEVEELYADSLDQIYSEVKLGEVTYMPSDIERNCDPVAFRSGVSDYASHYFYEVQGD